MSRNGILLTDYQYLEAYDMFKRMRGHGVKYDCAIAELAKESKVAKRTLQRAFKRLSQEC